MKRLFERTVSYAILIAASVVSYTVLAVAIFLTSQFGRWVPSLFL